MVFYTCPRCKKEIDFGDFAFQTEEKRQKIMRNERLRDALENDITLKLLDEMRGKFRNGQFQIVSVFGEQGKGKSIVGFDITAEICRMIDYKFDNDNLGFSYAGTLQNLAVASENGRIKRSVFMTDEQEAEHGKGRQREFDQITSIINVTRIFQTSQIFVSPDFRQHNHHYVFELFDYGFELLEVKSEYDGEITEITNKTDIQAGETIIEIKTESGTHGIKSKFWSALKEVHVKAGDSIIKGGLLAVLDARTHTRCLVSGTGVDYVGFFVSEFPAFFSDEFFREYDRRKNEFVQNALMSKGSERYKQRMKIVEKLVDDDNYWRQWIKNHKIIYIKVNHISGWTEDEYKELVDLTEIERMKKYGELPTKPKTGKTKRGDEERIV